MKEFEYFKVNSVEELKKAYYMFEDKWAYSLKGEINYFSVGYRYVISDTIGIYLHSNVPKVYTEIPSPVRNINNLNKLI